MQSDLEQGKGDAIRCVLRLRGLDQSQREKAVASIEKAEDQGRIGALLRVAEKIAARNAQTGRLMASVD